jgi:hypothetical protein
MADLRASFGKPFKYQVAAYRLRLAQLQGTVKWDDIWQAQHDRAFMVAGALKADLLADLALAVDKAVSEGTTLETFRKDFRAIVEKNGWHGWTGEGTKGGEAWRTRVIYRTNLSTSYAAGRFAQLSEAGFPFWVYFHGNSLEPRHQHLAWDGMILKPDHPFWATHYPPNGWGCSCYASGARTLEGARRLGGKPDLDLPEGWQVPTAKTGAPPGIDKGWAYAPGASVAHTVAMAAEKIAVLPPILGSDFGNAMQDVVDRVWPVWLADTIAGGGHTPILAGVLSKDLIAALDAKGIAPATASIMVKPGLISGPKVARHERSENALSSEDWLLVPQLLRKPDAVLLDNKSGTLIYVLPKSGTRPQLVVHLDYKTRIKRQTVTTNMVVSAYHASAVNLRSRVSSGGLTLILGHLG